MKRLRSSTPLYVISAQRRDGPIQRARTNPASALVLAMAWRDVGFTEVVVLDPFGNALTSEEYAEIERVRRQERMKAHQRKLSLRR